MKVPLGLQLSGNTTFESAVQNIWKDKKKFSAAFILSFAENYVSDLALGNSIIIERKFSGILKLEIMNPKDCLGHLS